MIFVKKVVTTSHDNFRLYYTDTMTTMLEKYKSEGYTHLRVVDNHGGVVAEFGINDQLRDIKMKGTLEW